MKFRQRLSSGIIIMQDIQEAVRCVVFETNCDGWRYATHGGTISLVSYHDKVYGITCRHVLADFNVSDLVITDTRFGKRIAAVSAIYQLSQPEGHAEQSDLNDIIIIEFSSDLSFFDHTPYILDKNTFAKARTGDCLIVEGVLKELTEIDDVRIRPTYCSLEYVDVGPYQYDIAVRKAETYFRANLDFRDITGISGGLVFNKTQNVLSGIAVRGNLRPFCRETVFSLLYYIDIFDIINIFDGAIGNGEQRIQYKKFGMLRK